MTEKRREKISGITHPWVYMGMLFSTFCWHVEDLWVNSLNYNHKGSIKTWYIVPGDYKDKFDDYVRNTYCTNSQKKNLLDRITFMIDPLELIKNGIPVYKTYQRPRDFICTFFRVSFFLSRLIIAASPRALMSERQLTLCHLTLLTG